MYSRRMLALNRSKVALARGSASSAVRRDSGISGSSPPCFATGALATRTPSSFNAIARRSRAMRVFSGGRIRDGSDPAQVAHGARFRNALQEGSFPECEGAVVLERSHVTQDAVVREAGRSPSDGLVDLGRGGMHRFAQMAQYRPGKLSGILDVFVDARVTGQRVVPRDCRRSPAFSLQQLRRSERRSSDPADRQAQAFRAFLASHDQRSLCGAALASRRFITSYSPATLVNYRA